MKNVIAVLALFVSTLAFGQNQSPVSGINGVFVLPNSNIQEEFCGGTPATTQLIGEYSWDRTVVVGGTNPTAAVASVANHPCLITLTTAATTGDGVNVSLGPGVGTLFPGSTTNWQSEHIAELNQVATGSYRIGFGTVDAATAIPTNGIYFRFLIGTDTAIQACSDTSSTETCTSTGVTPSATDYVDFLMSSPTIGNVTFTVNDITHPASGTVNLCPAGCSAIATIPTVVLSPFFNIVSTSNTADIMTIDYFGGSSKLVDKGDLPMKKILIALLLSISAFGQNQSPTQGINGSFILPNINLQEEFCGSPVTNHAIGKYGWDLTIVVGGASTVAGSAGVAAHPCLLLGTTAATTTDGYTISLGPGVGLLFPGNSTNWQAVWILAPEQVTTGSYREGFGTVDAATAIPTNGIYFRFIQGTDTYFEACSDTASTETCTATTVSPTTGDYYDFYMNSNTVGNVIFTVTDTTHPATSTVTLCPSGCSGTATVPTVVLSPFFNMVSTGSTAEFEVIDYFGYQQIGVR